MGALKSELIAQIPKLRAYALLLTRSGAEADDLVQETLMRAWRFQDSFHSGTNLKAWLFKILRNAFLGAVAKDRNLVEDADEKFTSKLKCEPDQEWRLRYQELIVALKTLPHSSREALLLVCATGLTYEEAAVVCCCSVGTVKSRVSRARARLVELLDEGPGPRSGYAPPLRPVAAMA